MTTLLVQELKSELTHEFSINGSDRKHIACFSPYLYVHNMPSGTFTFEIIKSEQSIISHSFTSSDIQTSVDSLDDYIHVFYPVTSETPVQMESGSYTAKLSASGYSFSSDSFLGWIQQHEDIQNEMGYTPISDAENPLAMRLKIHKQGIL